MLKQRVLTALVLAAVFGGFLFATPPFVFSLFLVAAVLVGAWEWSRLAGIATPAFRVAYVVVVGLLVGWAGYATGLGQTPADSALIKQILLVATGWWAVALLWVQGYPSSAVLWGHPVIRSLMGLLVLVPAWLALALLAYQDHLLIVLVILIVACADVGAYFSGKAFGRRKLAPAVSPGKTLEGFFGGLATVLVICLGFLYMSPSQWPLWWQWTIVATGTALVSVLGDLLESMVKRHRGVKDSGVILPGHGGILDRIDSVSAAAPVFTLLYLLLIPS